MLIQLTEQDFDTMEWSDSDTLHENPNFNRGTLKLDITIEEITRLSEKLQLLLSRKK